MVVFGSMLMVSCGKSVTPLSAPTPAGRGQFVACSGASSGAPSYAILDSPGPDCKPLLAGQDYADGRVIIGLKPATTDSDLSLALAAFGATVISSEPLLGARIISVPKGSVPQAVIGLARYSFIAFAAPDLIAHINHNT